MNLINKIKNFNDVSEKILTKEFREGAAKVCEKIRQMFLDGDCDHLTADDLETWMKLSSPAKFFTGEEAVNYSRLGNSRFYDYRRAGLIRDPEKIRGYPKPLYSRTALDDDLEHIASLSEKEIRRRVLSAKGGRK